MYLIKLKIFRRVCGESINRAVLQNRILSDLLSRNPDQRLFRPPRANSTSGKICLILALLIIYYLDTVSYFKTLNQFIGFAPFKNI